MSSSNIKLGVKAGEHGTHAFYKSFQFLGKTKWRTVQLGKFFFVRIGRGKPICIGELQLVWTTRNVSSPLCSIKLYFLPEQMPDGRQLHHGEDEIVVTEKIVLSVKDLIKWIIYEGVDWSLGRAMMTPTKDCECSTSQTDSKDGLACNVIIVNFTKYCQIRAMLKRVEGFKDLDKIMALPCFHHLLGLPSFQPNTYVLFCRESVDHPELESHDYRCDHLAPSLKGRPRKNKNGSARSKRGSKSEEEKPREDKEHKKKATCKEEMVIMKRGKGRPRKDMQHKHILASKENFTKALYKYMKEHGTPITRVPSLGFKKLDLYVFFKLAHQIGGFHEICQKRLWKHLYDQMGGNPNNTSAATCTKRHYEKLLLSFENHLRRANGLPIPVSRKHDDSENMLPSTSAVRKPEPSRHMKRLKRLRRSAANKSISRFTITEPRKLTRSVMMRRQHSMNTRRLSANSREESVEKEIFSTPSPQQKLEITASMCSTTEPVQPVLTKATASANSTWTVPSVSPPMLTLPSDIITSKTTVDSAVAAPLVVDVPSTPTPTDSIITINMDHEQFDGPEPAHNVAKCDMPRNVLGPCYPDELTTAQRSPWSTRSHSIVTNPDILPEPQAPNCRISLLKRRVTDSRDLQCVLNLSKKRRPDFTPAHSHYYSRTPIQQQCGAIDLTVKRKNGLCNDQPVAYIKKEVPSVIDLTMSSPNCSDPYRYQSPSSADKRVQRSQQATAPAYMSQTVHPLHPHHTAQMSLSSHHQQFQQGRPQLYNSLHTAPPRLIPSRSIPHTITSASAGHRSHMYNSPPIRPALPIVQQHGGLPIYHQHQRLLPGTMLPTMTGQKFSPRFN